MAGIISPTFKSSKEKNGNQRKSSSKLSKSESASESYYCPDYLKELLKNLNIQRKSGKFYDVEIIAGGTAIKAHKSVLSASSPYFKAMFSIGLKEQELSTIEIHLISGSILNILIDFIYTGKINIVQHNVQELFVAADMLQLSNVVEFCAMFLQKHMHSSNAIGIYKLSESHHCSELKNYALNFIEANFPLISNEEEFHELPKDQLVKFLSSEFLKVESEYQVLQAALKWISYNLTERRCYVFEILRHVRIPLLSICLLDRAIKDCSDESLKVALRSIRKDFICKKGNLVPLVAEPRVNAKRTIFVIGGSKRELGSVWTKCSDCYSYNSIERFDTFKREWCKAAPMSLGRILPGIAKLDGLIYVVGGEEDSQVLSNGECYDPHDNSWTKISSMIVPRCEFGLCAINGKLYAVGGWAGVDIDGSIERYDPLLNEWTIEGNLPEPLFSMGVVSFEGLIYVVGGCTHSKRHLQNLRSFNPLTGEWCDLPPMSVPRSQMGVAVLERHLYVVGGTNRFKEVLQSVEKYSFDTNKWSSVCQMRVGRTCPAVAADDGFLFVMGGMLTHEVNFWRAQITIDFVECYDPISEEWIELPALPESRGEAGAIVY